MSTACAPEVLLSPTSSSPNTGGAATSAPPPATGGAGGTGSTTTPAPTTSTPTTSTTTATGGAGGATTSTTSTTTTSTTPGPCVDTTSDPFHCGACDHSCLGGACVDSVCQVAAIPAQNDVYAIATNDTDVYWVDMNGDLYRWPRAGAPVLMGKGHGGARGPVALDATYAYWAANKLRRVPLLGGTPEDLSNEPLDLVVETAFVLDGPYAYYASGSFNEIRRIPLTGGSQETIFDGVDTFSPLVRDASSLYFVTEVYPRAVAWLPLAGGAPQTLVYQSRPIRSMQVDDTDVYWTVGAKLGDSTTGLQRMPKGGGISSVIVPVTATGIPWKIAIDANDVYWTEAHEGTVSRMPKAGGPPVVLSTEEYDPTAIFVDDKAVYWGSRQGGAAGFAYELRLLAK